MITAFVELVLEHRGHKALERGNILIGNVNGPCISIGIGCWQEAIVVEPSEHGNRISVTADSDGSRIDAYTVLRFYPQGREGENPPYEEYTATLEHFFICVRKMEEALKKVA